MFDNINIDNVCSKSIDFESLIGLIYINLLNMLFVEVS